MRSNLKYQFLRELETDEDLIEERRRDREMKRDAARRQKNRRNDWDE